MPLAKPVVLGFNLVGFLIISELNGLTEEPNKCQRHWHLRIGSSGGLDKETGLDE